MSSPYTVNNLALTGQPFFGRIWRWALRRKLDGPALAGMIINVRNAFQVWVSVDHRYGPLYNQANAEVLYHALLRYDYPMERDDVPVYVIGYSGAGQMAVGTMTYLREWLPGPLYTISLGGVYGSDPGLLATDHLFHLHGRNDRAIWLRHLAPGRWPIFAASEYNRAKRQGRISYNRYGAHGPHRPRRLYRCQDHSTGRHAHGRLYRECHQGHCRRHGSGDAEHHRIRPGNRAEPGLFRIGREPELSVARQFYCWLVSTLTCRTVRLSVYST